MRSNLKKYLPKAKNSAIVIIVLFVIVQFLPDRIIFSDTGKSIGLPIAVAPFNGFYSPINGSKSKLETLKVVKNKPGVSSLGSIVDASGQTNGEVVLFPQKGFPVFEFNAEIDQEYKRMKEVKLYPLEDSYFSPFVSETVANELDLLNCSYRLCELEYKNQKGIYYYRERYNNGLVEKQNVSNGVHFKLRKGIIAGEKTLIIEKDRADNEVVRSFIQKKVDGLNDLVNDTETLDLGALFDMNYMCRFFIHAQITGKTKLHKMRWIYRLTNGKIYPIAEGHNTIDSRNGKPPKGIWKKIMKSKEMKNLLLELEKSDFLNRLNSSLDKKFNENIAQLSRANRSKDMSQRELNFRLREDLKIAQEHRQNLVRVFKKRLKKDKFKSPKVKPLNVQLKKRLLSLGATVSGEVVTFNNKKVVLQNDLTLPRGYSLFLSAGTQIRIGEGKSLIVNGQLTALGTKENPVTITSFGDKPFGVVGAVGNDKKTSKLTYFSVSNGSEGYVDGKFFSGGINIYHQNCELSHVSIQKNNADDGLNLKYAQISISQSNFVDNWADQVDLDFCTGKIESCLFKASTSDFNGDGLDLSGSDLSIVDCEFIDLKDKGISIGEKSSVRIRKSQFSGNKNAITAKDLSVGTIDDCTFIKNELVFHLYRKKVIFGGAKLTVGKNNFIENTELKIVDQFSELIDGESKSDILKI